MTANDNTLSEDDDVEEITDEEMGELLGSAAHLGTLVERNLAVAWLDKNAADFLFEPGLDPKLQEYGTTVLELVAEALRAKEHWTNARMIQETLQ